MSADATPHSHTNVGIPPGAISLPETENLGARIPRLFALGDLALLHAPSVAVVGSRDASPAGLALATAFAQELARAGVVVMSGLAFGIDAAAHRSAMASRGRTVAVIGTPLTRVYPTKHAALQAQIGRDHLLLSPFAPGSPTLPGHFAARNRVMARLALATLVVEAGERSGTRHMVRDCLNVGRPVYVTENLANDSRVAWVGALVADGKVAVARTAKHVVAALASDGLFPRPISHNPHETRPMYGV